MQSTQAIITDQLPQRSEDDHPLTVTGGKQDIAEEEAGYLQILAPVQHHHAQERGGSDNVSTTEEHEESIYDNDDCFPAEFHAKMRQHAQEKNMHSWRTTDKKKSIQDYLLESLSQRYISSASSSDEEVENPAEQTKASQRKLSVLINALDLRPEALMRNRSSGISRQQAKSAKRIKRKKKSSSLMVHPTPEIEQQTGTIWYRQLPVQEELISSSSPPSQVSPTQKQKLESFEKLLEAQGIPKQEQHRPLEKTRLQKRRESLTRSESMPLGVHLDSPHPLPLPEAAQASKGGKDVTPETAWDRAAALVPILEPEHS